MTSEPRVGVVVLNHNGGDLTLASLASIEGTDWPADRLDVALVDNASTDGVVARVRDAHPNVRIIESATNTGFAGGCNLGIRALGTDVDFVALVNNDAAVEPGWLRPLVDALAADPELGAAGSKILFAGKFVDVTIASASRRRGRLDHRELGVRVSGARVDGEDVWSRAQLVSGFWGRDPSSPGEPTGEWTNGDALLRLPAERAGSRAELRLAAEVPSRVTLRSGDDSTTADVVAEPGWCDVMLGGSPQDIVNNVGTELLPDGYAADRGYLDPDDGRYGEAEDVFAWCGAAVLLRRTYLDDVGLFDERLFLYYEDVELSWRGHEHGWRYRYVPASAVRHVHAATSREGSALKDHYNERNRLLVLRRHGTASEVRQARSGFLRATASYARRDILSPLLHGRRPRGEIVRRRLRAFGAYLRHSRSMRRDRAD